MAHLDDRSLRTAAPRGTDPARLVLVTAPTVEPVSVDELREFVRVDARTEARTLGLVLTAARSYFERLTGLALLSQEWRMELDRTPCGREIEIPRAPLLAITHIKYKAETTGTLTVWSSAAYTLAGTGIARAFGRVWLNEDSDWPDLGSFPGALQVTFTAGFGTAADAVPSDLRLAVLLLAAHWYENRLPLNVGNIINPLPHSLDALIEMHRVANIG